MKWNKKIVIKKEKERAELSVRIFLILYKKD
ncbi:hypothetical protein C095_01740 [Fusobacterium necrophorum subsp. funduliforme B35]|uniref:Uncharacterized protein n=1 Tax=Fusobacterium necrophorum subsp. funduliforme B35 TaxID=1226633 RepID=A0A0B4EKT1_9FUSO|nr:hypothetical protein C095_01740 [Fusobacterium necrophorum subsp. funduliforme B35]